MAGRPKITQRKMENMGLGKLSKFVTDQVERTIEEKHPLELDKKDNETLDAIAILSPEEYRSFTLRNLKLLQTKITLATINAVPSIPERNLPYAGKLVDEQIARLEGNSVTKVEQKRAILNTNEEYEEFLTTHLEDEVNDDK
jgi:hypothetical protein